MRTVLSVIAWMIPYCIIGILLLPSEQISGDLTFCAETQGCWLRLSRYNSEEKWNPCFTDITSDFRPVIQKDGAKWRIVFETRDVTTEFRP